MNTVKLNEFLRPYGLECTSRALNDTISALREFGVDVRNKGVWDNQGVWIEERPIADETLGKLIYAVSTNPFLSQAESTEMLQKLTPLVTVYQEPMLHSAVETERSCGRCDGFYENYRLILDAIANNRRIVYTVENLKYDADAKSVEFEEQWGTLFTPKCIYLTKAGVLYLVGYNHPDRKVEAVPFDRLCDVKLAFKHKAPNTERIHLLLEQVDPREHIPGEKKEVLYRGPISLRCRGQYLQDLVRYFGMPSEPVRKDARCRAIYHTECAEITPETLLWLYSFPGHGVRILGPKGLTEAVRRHCAEISEVLLDRRLKACKQRIHLSEYS